VARIPLVIPIIESAERPVYQQIAAKALHLSRLGLSLSKIAKALGVTEKTVARFLKRGSVVVPDPGRKLR
jgi:transposase-like protein